MLAFIDLKTPPSRNCKYHNRSLYLDILCYFEIIQLEECSIDSASNWHNVVKFIQTASFLFPGQTSLVRELCNVQGQTRYIICSIIWAMFSLNSSHFLSSKLLSVHLLAGVSTGQKYAVNIHYK